MALTSRYRDAPLRMYSQFRFQARASGGPPEAAGPPSRDRAGVTGPIAAIP